MCGLIATLANPYGLGLWIFLAKTVRFGRPYIEEWQPVYAVGGWYWLFWFLPAVLAVLAASRVRREFDPAYAVIVLFLGVSALLVNRLDSFFMLAVVLLMAEPLASGWHQRTAVATTVRTLVPAATIVGLGGAVLILVRLASLPIGRPPMPEPEAASFIEQNSVRGRVLVWFDWGEYVIWHFAPSLKVSIDGRRETVYSDRLIADHMAFYAGDPGAQHLPDRIGADYIWIPRRIPVARKLRSWGWEPIFDGPESTILRRQSKRFDVRTAGIQQTTQVRVFPGP